MPMVQAAQVQRAVAVLCDLDALTEHGRLPPAHYAALDRLRDSGLLVVPTTGRAAGWCDLIARLWPVDAVIGECGALWTARAGNRLVARTWQDEAASAADRARLAILGERVMAAVPGSDLATDQPYRLASLAIDVGEDVPELPPEATAEIVHLFRQAGAQVATSPDHVTAWLGGFALAPMTTILMAENFGLHPESCAGRLLTPGSGQDFAAWAEAVLAFR